MENLHAMEGAFKRTLQSPENPDAATPSSLHPPHSRTNPDYKNCCTNYARAKVDIVPGTTREVLANGVYCDLRSKASVGGSNGIALCTNAGRVSTSSFFLSCQLMFTTVL